ncbi:hypothetical protein SynA1544_01466 [Synechococcus sp. A15-44]|nr:hypothetical protein SynA1544_01466 [Synechococcus sp. A15-44]
MQASNDLSALKSMLYNSPRESQIHHNGNIFKGIKPEI